ncbi:ABC transporter substrate-binding protein [Paraburkholderia aspalathi]|nr:ABC transporter substrate-binding protein [Paraburkholderia aspalathi]
MVVAACASSAFAQEIPITPDVKESGKLTIASSLSYAPFEYVDENGKPVGVDIELASAVAELMNVKLDILTIPFASQIPSLAAGRVKVAWATFSVTEERLKQVDFVAFLQAGTVISTLPEHKDSFARKTDICGKAIAVQTGSAADFAADKLDAECKAANLEGIKKSIYPELKDTIQSVLSGRSEALLDDTTSAGYYENTSGGKLVLAGESYFPAPLGVAVAKGDVATAAMMDAALQKLISDGRYETILKKYNLTTSGLPKTVIYTDASQLAK